MCNKISIKKSGLLLGVIGDAFTDVGASELGFAGYQQSQIRKRRAFHMKGKNGKKKMEAGTQSMFGEQYKG